MQLDPSQIPLGETHENQDSFAQMKDGIYEVESKLKGAIDDILSYKENVSDFRADIIKDLEGIYELWKSTKEYIYMIPGAGLSNINIDKAREEIENELQHAMNEIKERKIVEAFNPKKEMQRVIDHLRSVLGMIDLEGVGYKQSVNKQIVQSSKDEILKVYDKEGKKKSKKSRNKKNKKKKKKGAPNIQQNNL